ncbi:hypothetical protein H5T51_02465 [Candidatus Bathyarchaeota archaeon]|nr:hypothetical protein [Candidatus Bathyarchaeota archaeon]
MIHSQSYPYVVFLPSEEKHNILSAIFGSKASIDVLKFSLKQGIGNKIYQKDLVEKLPYSNKTIIENLKTLTKLGILTEEMEKTESSGRIVWVKSYKLSDIGKWFALLLAEEKELTDQEKAEILENTFRSYIRWVKTIAEKLNVSSEKLRNIFEEEMKE